MSQNNPNSPSSPSSQVELGDVSGKGNLQIPSTVSRDKGLSGHKSSKLLIPRISASMHHDVKPFVYVVALVAAIGGLTFGYDIGGSGGTFVMSYFRTQFGWGPVPEKGVGEDPAVTLQQALITSIFSVGCMFGSLFTGAMADNLGRKKSLMIAAVIFSIGAFIQLSSFEIIQLIIGRFIGGTGVGMLSMLVTLYQSEMAPEHIRGVLVTLQQLCITLGILIAALSNVGFANVPIGWRFSYGLNGFFTVIMVGLLFCLPESPRWLMAVGREEEAIASLSLIRQQGQIEEEIELMREELEWEKELGEGEWKDLCKAGPDMMPYRMMVGMMIQFLQQFTGINAIMYFAPIIFGVFLEPAAALWANVGIQTVNFLATFLAVGCIDSAGRRFLLLVGGTGQAIFCLVIAILASPLYDFMNHIGLGIAIVFCIGLYVVNFSFGWGPIAWVVCAEIFPQRLRGKAMTVSTFMNWTMNTVIGQVTPFLLQPSALDIWGTFIFFGCCCVIMTLWVIFYLPETKGVSLEHMDALFRNFDAPCKGPPPPLPLGQEDPDDLE